jgi:hypothetical protein
LYDARKLTIIRSLEKERESVQLRIKNLEAAEKDAKFDPERVNIWAAIRGYQTGAIGCSNIYTLIWAGQIVETAASYAEFTNGRTARLDRYVRDHGYGWLWWEPPLDTNSDNVLLAKRGTELHLTNSWTGMGHYYINQGYWKRFDWVARLQSTGWMEPVPEIHRQNFLHSSEGQVYCQQEGPKLMFNSLFDSGATYASLHREDFELLSIDFRTYGAQSLSQCQTANGMVATRVYELAVSVVDQVGRDLVDANNAVFSAHPKYLGGLCPVMIASDGIRLESGERAANADGSLTNHRLSGIMPMLACYLATAPARNACFLGEDRRDVLGAQRMPGQMRWDRDFSHIDPLEGGEWAQLGDPRVKFTHQDGRLVDEDAANFGHSSRILINPGTVNEQIFTRDPGMQAVASQVAHM